MKSFARNRPTVHFILSFGNILFWVFVFKSSVLDANNIPSGSMEPTLKVGDLLFVNKMRYTLDIPFTDIRLWHFSPPQRGDIVTFTPDENAHPSLQGKTLVKRVIGVPGDIIQIYDHEVLVHGQKYETEVLADQKEIFDLGYGREELQNFLLYEETIRDPDGTFRVKHHILKWPKRASRHALFGRIIKNPITRQVRQAMQGVYKRVYSYLALRYLQGRRENIDITGMRYPKRLWVIPEGYYMVAGDNRGRSDDSRGCNMVAGFEARQSCERGEFSAGSEIWGLIPRKNIHGKVLLTYFSVNWGRPKPHCSEKGQINPIFTMLQWMVGCYPDASVRWDRIFKRIY
ncbi:MAG: signal peptidase I [Leptospiraceae bacterium]|nr:signal peptidase I [Leptospiraceae bacterium]MDW8307527.1 signal peptidase I [Leptospiraceae bacterium]